MLCTVNLNFSPHLLDIIRQNQNDEFARFLENYRQIQPVHPAHLLKDSIRATLLHYAAEYGNANIAQYLLNSNSEIDAQDKFGRSPLMLAAMNNHETVVEMLLKADAKIHIVDVQGKTPLQTILELKTSSSRMINVLLRCVSLDKIMESITREALAISLFEAGFTLNQAVLLNNLELIELLLDQGVYAVNDRDSENGETALHTAVKNENLGMVVTLFEHGADVDALDSVKATPMYYLYKNNENDDVRALELLKVLMISATSFTTSNDYSHMQIYRVLVRGSKKAVQLVLKSIDNLNESDKFGNTVVHYIARNSNPDVIDALRGRIFNANKRNHDNYTPLHFATFTISSNAVKFLLENKADVHARGHSYETPLHRLYQKLRSVPQHCDAKKCIELLLKYGSDAQDYDVVRNFDWISEAYNKKALAGQNDADEILTLVEPLLERIAVNEVISENPIDEYTMEKIKLQPSWIKFFGDAWEREVERMNETTIYGNVTLSEFLTNSLRRIGVYVKNVVFVLELKKFIIKLESSSPYPILLKKRLLQALRYNELKEYAIPAVYGLINIEDNAFQSVAEYVVGYLDSEDMKNVYLAIMLKKRAQSHRRINEINK